MDEPIKTIRALIERIEAPPSEGQGVESQALDHLTHLLAELEAENMPRAARCTAQLHQFWLQSVPWCMPLSKDLEKLLVQLDEQNE